MAGVKQKSSVATFLLWSLQKQDGWVQRSENNIKDITEIYIASWLVHLKCGTLSKTTKIRFSVKVDFSYVFSKPSKSFNVKTSSKQLLDRGKDSLLLPYTYTPSSSTLGLLLHVQFYQRCEPMISKMWKKNESVLWQPHYYNLLTEKKKIAFLKYSFFLKTYSCCQSQETLFKRHL